MPPPPTLLDNPVIHPFFPNRFIVYGKHEIRYSTATERQNIIEFAIVPLHWTPDWVDETRGRM